MLASNCPEWHIADLAIMSAGAVTVPVYPTSSSSQVAYVLDNSDARVCFVDDTEQLAKVLLHLPSLPSLERIVSFGSAPGLDHAGLLMTLDDLRAGGAVDLAGQNLNDAAIAHADVGNHCCGTGAIDHRAT